MLHNDLRSWERVYERLEELVRVAGAAGDAIAAGDAPRARVLVHETRSIRAALARAHSYAQADEIPVTREGIELIAKMKVANEQSLIADRIARAWIERALPDEETLRTIEGGHLAIADRLLPPVWDVELDVVALVAASGDDVRELAWALDAFGQRRIVVYAPGTPEDAPEIIPGEFPPQTIVARCRGDLGNMMIYADNPPERLKVYASQPEGLDVHICAVEESFGSLILGRNTVAQFGGLWLEQGMRNLPKIAQVPSIAHFGDRFEGMPMIIVAPGPSLSKNAKLLREVSGKALICTFSHTLAALRRANVRPNIVLAVDMEDLRYHFDDHDTTDIDALGLGATVHPELFSARTNMTFALAANANIDDWLCKTMDEEMAVSSGGSVAHTAFSLGRRLGCDPIILVGQDLSFPDGKVYCEGNVDEATVAEIGEDGTSLVIKGWSDGYAQLESIAGRRQAAPEPVIRVPANGGGEVVTSSVFALFRRWFIDVAHAVDDETRLINCTEGGAYIDGWEHATLRETIDDVIAGRDEVDIRALFSDVERSIDSEHRRQRVTRRLKETQRSIQTARRFAKRCVSLTKKLSSGGHGSAAEKLTGKLATAEKKLLRALKPIGFVAIAAQAEVHRGQRAARDEDSLADNLRASKRLFDAVVASCEHVAGPLSACLDLMNATGAPSD